MVHGYFPPGTNVPYIEVAIFSQRKIARVAVILDTGFSGELKIDQETANELGIIAARERWGVGADGEKILAKAVYVYVEIENKKIPVEILIFNGPQLAGTGLFAIFGYKVVVDCKNRMAHLESAL